MLHSSASESAGIPATLTQPGALKFWAAVMVTGFGAGASAAALMLLLRVVQHWAWPGPGTLLESASAASPGRHFAVLLAAGLLTGAGQMILVRLASGNGIDITEAIWFSAGRLPALRTLGSAYCRSLSSAWGLRWAAKARQSKLEPLSPMRFPIQPSCPTNNAVCWWRAAPERGWPRPMECRLAARCSRLKCCAESWRCGWCCPRCSHR